MKKYLIIALLVGIVAVALAARRTYHPSGEVEGTGQGSVLMDAKMAWVTLDTTTSAGTEPNALRVGERTYAVVTALITAAANDDEEMSYMVLPATWNNIRFRCAGISDANAVKYDVHLGSLGNGSDCELAYVGELDFTIGTQSSIASGYEMADTITFTDANNWTQDTTVQSPADNTVAEFRTKLAGADFIVVVPTTAACNAILLIKGY